MSRQTAIDNINNFIESVTEPKCIKNGEAYRLISCLRHWCANDKQKNYDPATQIDKGIFASAKFLWEQDDLTLKITTKFTKKCILVRKGLQGEIVKMFSKLISEEIYYKIIKEERHTYEKMIRLNDFALNKWYNRLYSPIYLNSSDFCS